MSFSRAPHSPEGGGGESPKRHAIGKVETEVETKMQKALGECRGGFACECSICLGIVRLERRSVAAAKVDNENNTEINEMLYEGISRDFFWFIN